MEESQIKAIIQQLIKATNEFDLKTALALFADDAVIDDVSVGKDCFSFCCLSFCC
jgi:hypothetical protein